MLTASRIPQEQYTCSPAQRLSRNARYPPISLSQRVFRLLSMRRRIAPGTSLPLLSVRRHQNRIADPSFSHRVGYLGCSMANPTSAVCSEVASGEGMVEKGTTSALAPSQIVYHAVDVTATA